MHAEESFCNDEIVSKIIDDLNTKNFTEIVELVEMKYGSKPEAELQRLTSAEVIAIDSIGLRLICNYHRWETAEINDRMFHQHTDETRRYYTIPYPTQPRSKEEILRIIEKMIDDAKENYLKGFE